MDKKPSSPELHKSPESNKSQDFPKCDPDDKPKEPHKKTQQPNHVNRRHKIDLILPPHYLYSFSDL